MSDREIFKKYSSFENYIYFLEQENKRLKQENQQLKQAKNEVKKFIYARIKSNSKLIRFYHTCINTNINSNDVKKDIERSLSNDQCENFMLYDLLSILTK